MSTIRSCRLLVALIAGTLLAIVGCESAVQSQFTPSNTQAREALEKALSAWRDGKSIGEIGPKPPIKVVDSVWTAGEKIDSFEILDEKDPGDGTKQFKVKLNFKPPKATEEIRYVVYGREPVWVSREDDYQRTMNMDNNPAAPK